MQNKKSGNSKTSKSIKLRHEGDWCPVTSPVAELNDEVLTIKRLVKQLDLNSPKIKKLTARKNFLLGIIHARTIIKAATGGLVG